MTDVSSSRNHKCEITYTPSTIPRSRHGNSSITNKYRSYLVRQKKSKIQSFAEQCTLHGINEIANADNLALRIFWISAFVLALGAAVTGCGLIMRTFILSPVVVSYVINDSDVLPLPDITICPFNRFNKKFFKEHNISSNVSLYMELAYGFTGGLYDYQHSFNMEKNTTDNMKKLFEKQLIHMNLTFNELIERAAIPCELFIDYCVKNGKLYNCCDNSTTEMTSAGKCYRLLGQNQSAAGFSFGLTVVMRLPYDLYSPSPNNIHNDGVFVKLAEKNRGLDYDMTFVSSKTHTLMSLRATKYEFIDDPPRYECKENFSEVYSRVNCFDRCLYAPATKHCQCSPIALPKVASSFALPACDAEKFYGCLAEATNGTDENVKK